MNSVEQPIGVFTVDVNLNIRSWDESMAEMTGVAAEAAIGQSLIALYPDVAERHLTARFEHAFTEGTIELLAPAFHHYLIPCAPLTVSNHFDKMQQRATIAPLRENESVVGAIVTITDVTARLDRERDLAEQLASADEITRLRAAQALSEEGVEDEAIAATPKLVETLRDESWRVRQEAVSGLARQADAETIASILHLLRTEHGNLSILNSALQVLALSDVDIISPLTEFLRDPDMDLRVQAALALGEQRDLRAFPALLAAMEDADANVRYHAIEALGKIRAAEAVNALTGVAESGDFFLAFPALDALTQIGDPRVAPRLVPLLKDRWLGSAAADALGRLGDEEVVAPLVALLNQPDTPRLVIAQALATLYHRYEDSYRQGAYIADLVRSEISATGAQNLLDSLDRASAVELRSLALVLGWLEGAAVRRALTRLLGHPAARKEVIEALVRHGARVTELLSEQLAAEDLETRRAAVIALGRIGDARAVPALTSVLADEELVIETAGALAKIGDASAFESLLGLLGHTEAGVRQAAVSALNSLGHPQMAARAVRLLDDPDARVRESAVKIAGYFGFAECIDQLLARCRDDDENVRRAAVEHLPYLEDERALPALDYALRNDTPKVRAAAAHALGQMESADARPHLLAALGDADSWVRYFAARSIGQRGERGATGELGRMANTDAAGHVRIAALEALGQIGSESSVAILAPVAKSGDSEMACAALKSLGSVSHPDALPPLQAALRSPEPARRIAALRALAARGEEGSAEELRWVVAADEDSEVVQAAIDALAHLATPEAIRALIDLTALTTRREACINALAQLDAKNLEWIAQGLTHADVEVRRVTVEALGRMTHSGASERLSTALDDVDATVRLAAVNTLGRLGSRHAERKLVSMARTDPDVTVRRAAEKAIRRQL